MALRALYNEFHISAVRYRDLRRCGRDLEQDLNLNIWTMTDSGPRCGLEACIASKVATVT